MPRRARTYYATRHDFYRSRQWQRCRDAFMESRHHICERCGRPAVIAHHKRYLNESNYTDPSIALNPDNLEALCMECHNREHIATGATVEGLTFDGTGDLVKVESEGRRQ